MHVPCPFKRPSRSFEVPIVCGLLTIMVCELHDGYVNPSIVEGALVKTSPLHVECTMFIIGLS